MPKKPAEFKSAQTVAIISASAVRREAWSAQLGSLADLVVVGTWDTVDNAQKAGVSIDAVLVDVSDRRRRREQLGSGALSPREDEVMRLLARGCRDKELPARLQVTTHTARTFVRRAMAKLGASSRGEAVAIWSQTSAGAAELKDPSR
jgi:DNA-binding CsgD family transcriptional regulator